MILWLMKVTTKFPREHRFLLAKTVQETGLRFQEHLIEAGLSKGRTQGRALANADIDLTKLRYYFRLSKELGCLTPKQYQHSARLTTEVGKLLGGWRKSIH